MGESNLTLAQRIRVAVAFAESITIEARRAEALELVHALEANERVQRILGNLTESSLQGIEAQARAFQEAEATLHRSYRLRQRVMWLLTWTAFCAGFLLGGWA